jgi:predicted RNA binding protein YcfA (HicA-like mRNA interferase family)
MKTYSSREVIVILRSHGWEIKNIEGDHHHFAHDNIKGKVTLPHPVKEVPVFILKIIEKQTGIKF